MRSWTMKGKWLSSTTMDGITPNQSTSRLGQGRAFIFCHNQKLPNLHQPTHQFIWAASSQLVGGVLKRARHTKYYNIIHYYNHIINTLHHSAWSSGTRIRVLIASSPKLNPFTEQCVICLTCRYSKCMQHYCYHYTSGRDQLLSP